MDEGERKTFFFEIAKPRTTIHLRRERKVSARSVVLCGEEENTTQGDVRYDTCDFIRNTKSAGKIQQYRRAFPSVHM